MARRRQEEVDWYVEMSDMIERRERRRKWVILAVAVSVPILLMGTGALAIYGLKRGWLGDATRWFTEKPEVDPAESEVYEPVSVEKLQSGDIVYAQLDRNGFVTSISHFFRELGPDPEHPERSFTINRTDVDHGSVALYRLRNVGTGESHEFRDVQVEHLATGDWMITEDGQRKIRTQLEARMNVQIRLIRK